MTTTPAYRVCIAGATRAAFAHLPEAAHFVSTLGDGATVENDDGILWREGGPFDGFIANAFGPNVERMQWRATKHAERIAKNRASDLSWQAHERALAGETLFEHKPVAPPPADRVIDSAHWASPDCTHFSKSPRAPANEARDVALNTATARLSNAAKINAMDARIVVMQIFDAVVAEVKGKPARTRTGPSTPVEVLASQKRARRAAANIHAPWEAQDDDGETVHFGFAGLDTYPLRYTRPNAMSIEDSDAVVATIEAAPKALALLRFMLPWLDGTGPGVISGSTLIDDTVMHDHSDEVTVLEALQRVLSLADRRTK